jgi:hypothetical protein
LEGVEERSIKLMMVDTGYSVFGLIQAVRNGETGSFSM